jgi:uncharacterized protein (TIGR02147 family)
MKQKSDSEKRKMEESRLLKLRELAKKDSIVHFLNPRLFLKQLFEGMKAEFAVYGVRQFSFDLGFEATNFLHLVLNQKRNISVGSAQKISKILKLSELETCYLVTLVQYDSCIDEKKKHGFFLQLIDSRQKFEIPGLDSITAQYLSEPMHSLVRELFVIPRKSCEAQWVAQNFSPFLSLERARESLDLLLKLKLIAQNESGFWEATQKNISTGGSALGEVAFRYHNSMLNLSREALVHLPPEERDFGALTVGVSRESFESFKVKLGELMRELLLNSSQDADLHKTDALLDVVQFNFQCLRFRNSDSLKMEKE